MVPSLPKDVSDANKSPANDAVLFPSDEQLNQRTLWIAFVLVLGWTILGLAGALPLYLVATPCLAHLPPTARYTGALSTLQDLSLLRLLRLWDSGHETVTSYHVLGTRATLAGTGTVSNLRIRMIILAVLTGLLAVLPAMYKILKEFNRMVAYRKRWITVRCQENEMGWLSVRRAPGFADWGEKRLKSFILKTGLSSSLETDAAKNETRRRLPRSRAQNGGSPHSSEEEGNREVDIHSLFSIG